MEGGPPPGTGALVADDKLISRLAERIAEYSVAKRRKRAKKSKT